MAKAKTGGPAPKNTDQAVMDLLAQVRHQKVEIEKAKARPVWLTNTTLGTSEETVHDRVNLQTVTKPEKLVSLYTFLLTKEEQWKRANDELGLEAPAKWLNYPIEDWKTDLKTRAAQLTIDKKQKELQALEERIDKLISPEQRRELELAAITAELRKA